MDNDVENKIINEEDSLVKNGSTSHHKKLKKPIWITLIIMSIIGVLGLGFYFVLPTVQLNGKNTIEVPVFSEYTELGYNAKYLGKNISGEVKVEGNVNSSKVGEYKIKYSVKRFGITRTNTRVVRVVDNTKPEITLEGDTTIKICKIEDYIEPGFKANDNYDGDISNNVVVTRDINTNKITYTIEDSSYNKTIIYRDLEVGDKEPPVITLTGSSTVYTIQNNSYKELGYTVTDNCDKDLESKVVVSGNVDTSKVGSYTLTYTLTDSSNNTTTATRTVKVIAKPYSINDDPGIPGTIYLTFDDGPSNAYTGKILDILKDEGVKATFFVTMTGSDSLILREYQEGHSIGLHTASHEYSVVYSSVEGYFNDLKKVSDRVKRITGEAPMILRFPGGSSNTVSRHYCTGIMTALTAEVLNRGYRYYDWNVTSGDAGGCNPNSSACIYNNVVNSLSKTRANVVLMHDIKYYTSEAIRDIIRNAKARGFEFKVITPETAMVRQKVAN